MILVKIVSLKKLKKDINKVKDNNKKIPLLEKIIENITSEKLFKNSNFNNDEQKIIKSFNLISTKPKIFICNLNEKENLENILRNNIKAESVDGLINRKFYCKKEIA